MNRFFKGWKDCQPQAPEAGADLPEVNLEGYAFPNSMIEPYDVEREKELI